MANNENSASKINEKNVLETYSHLFERERHYNNLQNTARTLSSGWLMLTLSGLAYLVLKKEDESVLFSRYMLISLIPVVGYIGMCVLYVLDQVVYRKLLSATVLVGIQMEYDYHFLPPVHATSLLISQNSGDTGLRHRTAIFYLVPFAFFSLLSIISSILYASTEPSFWAFALIPICLLPLIGSCYTTIRIRGFDPKKNHAHIENEELREILNSGNFQAIVNKKHRS